MTDATDATDATDVPEAVARRFASGAFSSSLSVPDFAACLEMGLEPVGLVQGFCAMRFTSQAPWGGVGMGTGIGMGMAASPYAGNQNGFVQNYQCPHNMMSAEHRRWGQNYEQTWVQDAWHQGYSSAFSRMLEEATELKAHGVVGVFDTVHHLSDTGAVEFHLWGTAVQLRDAPTTTSPPWTTYLAGQRLAKIFEAGFAPVSIVATVSSVRVWAYCMTEYLMGGAGLSMWANNTDPLEVDQIVNARSAARQLVRKNARAQLHGDALHGVSVTISDREFGQGDYQTECLLRGNRIRRFKDFDPLPVPRPTVRFS